jgi:hypothetical protein
MALFGPNGPLNIGLIVSHKINPTKGAEQEAQKAHL